MSLSETFDHGAIIPWANMRYNTLTVDGSISQPSLPGSIGGAIGNSITPIARGVLRLSSTSSVIVYSFDLPNSPNNGAFDLGFNVLMKGGPPGNTNNMFYQHTESIAVITNNIAVATFYTIANQYAVIGFVAGVVDQSVTLVGQTVNFSVQNSAAGQTTDVYWEVIVKSLNTTL